MIAISVADISKQYRLGQVGRKTLSHDLNRWWYKARGKQDPYLKIGQENDRTQRGTSEYVWSLRDVSFDVQQGEVLGIIGRNGAGKSTLLKILSKVTAPTSGHVKLNGRTASLLEVGTGFHPELTGRDNIFLNGAILGMTRNEISSKFDEIVDFAGVERYIDTPVKRYSSGMYVRLAFAVAAHLEPDILIVDEVLAVGDAEFQKKCIGKMKDVSANEGRTILFVSHDMAAISTLTDRAICLRNGAVIAEGETKNVVRQYLEIAKAESGSYVNNEIADKPVVTHVQLFTSEVEGTHKHGEPLQIEVEVHMPNVSNSMSLSVQICNEREAPIVYTYVFDAENPVLRKQGLNRVRCIIPNCRLYQGTYFLRVHLAESKGRTHFETIDKICKFDVQMLDKTIEWGWQNDVCAYTEDFTWETIQ